MRPSAVSHHLYCLLCRTFSQPASGDSPRRRRRVIVSFEREIAMSSFTDEDRRQEAARRQRQRHDVTHPNTTECIVFGLRFASHEATDPDNPICPVCL